MEYLRKFNESHFVALTQNYQKWLSEAYDLNDQKAKEQFDNMWNNHIKPECSIYLNEIRGSKPILRGTGTHLGQDLISRKPRKDRVPRDINKEVHRIIDDEFLSQHGVKVRSSGIFTSKSIRTTEEYGWPCIIFPKGSFRYFWNPNVDDLFTHIEYDTHYMYSQTLDPGYLAVIFDVDLDGMTEAEENKFLDTHHEMAMDQLHEKLHDIVSGYKDTGLRKVKNQEISIICDEYYMMDIMYLKFVLEEFGIIYNNN